MILLHIHDERRRPPAASRRLDDVWTVLAVPLDGAADIVSCTIDHCLIEVDVTSLPKALRVRSLAARVGRGGQRIFACDRADHHAVTQARALGATRIIDRPIVDRHLLPLLAGAEPNDSVPASTVVGAIALDLAFRSIEESRGLSASYIQSVASSIADDIGDVGIEAWLRSIRDHHAGTYQHCLIVTGLATAFGKELRLSPSDCEKLTVSALLHDIGKARIDLAILDKQGPLTPEERTVVEMHPVWGEEHLRERAMASEEILDVVRHHHELLDGSGYPDRLKGDEISDLTRLLTIVDIFGALVEQRAYKAPMSGDAAFAILDRMVAAGKLERALVKAFRPVAAQLTDRPARRSA